jgi:GT2 family glycosyltransferase
VFYRIRGLFQRYVRAHCRIDVGGFSLATEDQPRLGYVDRVVLAGHRISFIGWSLGDRVSVIGSDGQVSTRPDIIRHDVAEALGVSNRAGFEITLPMGDGRFTVLTEQDGRRHEVTAEPVPARLQTRARRQLALRFGRTLFLSLPSILRAMLLDDPVARDRVKRALGMELISDAGALNPELFSAPDAQAPALQPDPEPVTLIMPVYNAFDLLPEVLERVLRHTDLPWHLILIEDCSSDARVRPWLRGWVSTHSEAHPGQIEMIENRENQGFIRSVNIGLRRAADIGRHVILLNSDAFVPAGWASRLMRPMLLHRDVATVTPMSNDAEIFSVPGICERVVLAPGQGDALDAVARQLHPDAGLTACPTGVGFCMAMNRSYLKKIPKLDTAFGRGYGEEVDWCQKARNLEARHLGVANLFVEHRGGESFGSEEKQKLILRNNARIARRYPAYDAEVQSFVTADPMNTTRLTLAVAWAAGIAGDRPVPVYMAHALGGGAENYLQGRIAKDLEQHDLPAVVLRVGGKTARWQLELHSSQGVVAGHTDDFALAERILAPLTHRHVVYSCGVGDPDPVSLPGYLMALMCNDTDVAEVLVHDYFMLSPSYTLLDDNGVYTGPVPEEATDKVHGLTRPDGTWVGLADWRAAWEPLMQAGRIVVFSEDSDMHIRTAFPHLADRIVLDPHELLAEVPHILPPAPRPGKPGRVLGVLGNIGYQKGAAVVADLGRRIAADPELKEQLGLVLVGNVDPAWMPPSWVPVHGDYHLSELPGLVGRYGITDWLIPSVWPETFSYTTHETLATGLPVHAFEIGAQGTAVARARNGHVIPLKAGDDAAGNILKSLKQSLN